MPITEPTTGQSPGLKEERIKKVHILLVDDNPAGLITLEAVLDSPEYQLIKASSGVEALKLVNEYDFALILMDVQMPGMDGFQAAKNLKKDPRYSLIPIIFITAIHKEYSQIHEGYQTGAVDYLFKPFEPHILRSKVHVFVDLYRKSQKIREQGERLLEAEQKEHEKRLLETELKGLYRYRFLANAIPHIIWKSDSEGRVNYLNHFWSLYSGMSIQQSTGDGWCQAFYPADYDVFRQVWEKARAKECEAHAECRLRRASDQSYRWHIIRIVPEIGYGGKITGWLGTCSDIHDRKIMEEQLRDSQRQLEEKVQERTAQLSHTVEALEREMTERQRIQKQILEISEREQRRLGIDLHDSLAQKLVGVSLLMNGFLRRSSSEKEEEEVREIIDYLRKAIEEAKRLSRVSYPVELERHGLFSALRELTGNIEKVFSIKCQFFHEKGMKPEDFSVESASHLYRIVQEAMHNAARHAKPQQIDVMLRKVEGGYEVVVEDNGGGMDSSQVSSGMGIETMRYRAELIGAQFKIEPREAGGTRIQVEFAGFES